MFRVRRRLELLFCLAYYPMDLHQSSHSVFTTLHALCLQILNNPRASICPATVLVRLFYFHEYLLIFLLPLALRLFLPSVISAP